MTEETRRIAEAWFDALDQADYARAMSLLDPEIVWINVPPQEHVTSRFQAPF